MHLIQECNKGNKVELNWTWQFLVMSVLRELLHENQINLIDSKGNFMPLKNFTRLELWNILISLYFFLSRTIFNTSHVVMRVTNGSNGDVVVRVKMKLPDSVPHIPGSGEMYVWYCLPCSGISARGTGKYVWVIDPAWGQGIGRVSFMRVYGRSCMRSIHSQKKNETNMKPSLPNKLRRRIKRTHSRSQQPCKFYETKQVLHRKRFEPPQDWFGTTTWLPFHCFGTPIWLPWRHGHTLHKGIFVWLSENSPPPPLLVQCGTPRLSQAGEIAQYFPLG